MGKPSRPNTPGGGEIYGYVVLKQDRRVVLSKGYS